jgi:SAM-dependent methyltransferase
MKLLNRIHEQHVAVRRARVLSGHLATLIPRDASVLDVGCGDGLIAHLIAQARGDLQINGVDVLLRDTAWISVEPFDGRRLPYDRGTVDVVMFVDVLHHTEDPMVLLCEAARVARRAIIIKDHFREGLLAAQTLRFMDRVGNCRHGVSLPFNYWRRSQWMEAFAALPIHVEHFTHRLRLYWWPASLLFDRSLHFIAQLAVEPSKR